MFEGDENACPQVKNTASPAAKKALKGGKKGRTIEEMYQKKSQLEHILLRPDTYSKFSFVALLNLLWLIACLP